MAGWKNIFSKKKLFFSSMVSVETAYVHSVSSAAAFKSILGFFPLASADLAASGGTMAWQRGHLGSASTMST